MKLTESEQLKTNTLATEIIGAAIEVHKELGAGLQKELYLDCLSYELELRGLCVLTNASQSIIYKEKEFQSSVLLELLVEDEVAVLCEAVSEIEEIHVLKLLNQIKQADVKLGLIFNFDVKYLRGDAIRRVVNGRW